MNRLTCACVVAGIFAGSASAAIPSTERAVLVALYNSTGGANWKVKTNWNGPAGTECTWYGVTCIGTNTTEIRLSNNQLTGTIPSLPGLTKLQVLDLSGNKLTGSIPTLSGMVNLYLFDVGSNQLTGSVPLLTGLTNLVGFFVPFNQLTGPIPSLAGLTNLQAFWVSFNQLTGTIPSLAGLIKLQDFHVSFNQLSGPLPAAPASLVAGSSALCPNSLTPSVNAAWDTATGSTPWTSGCNAPISINSGGVVNAASFDASAVAPGSLATLFGGFTGVNVATATTFPWPTTLFGLSVTFNGVAAPLYYTSASQVNVQVPWQMAGQTQSQVVVRIVTALGIQTTPASQVSIVNAAPGVFLWGEQQGIVTDAQSNQLITPSNPARAGTTYLTIYCTGLGLVTNQPATGSTASANPLSYTTLTPTVTIGGVPTNALFSGLAPGFVGLYQINVQVPAGAPVGPAVPLVVAMAGKIASTVSIAIQR